MSKRLPILSYREIVKALAKIGFLEVTGRGKGSHIFVHRASPPKGITIPHEKQIKRGTLRAIIREAEITVDEFMALL